ncbi:MAG: hypothetical protein VKP62_08950 [Candidatus Sericytochromatia bacterium]|nr:hypothetical protein [Candidatus Sericytochromatia bacterium]
MTPVREDLTGQRQLRFHFQGEATPLHLFKHRGESTHQAYLKALAYAFWREQGELTFDPATDYKVTPSLACLDLTGEVRLWVQVGDLPLDKLEYVLRHSDADQVCWVQEMAVGPANVAEFQAACDALLQRVKRRIHYRYTTKKLCLLIFDKLEDWFEPDAVALPEAHYRFIRL